MRVEIQLNENSTEWIVVTIETASAGRQVISEAINRALLALGEKKIGCYENSDLPETITGWEKKSTPKEAK